MLAILKKKENKYKTDARHQHQQYLAPAPWISCAPIRWESPIRQFASNYWTIHFAAYCELLVLFDYDFAPILGAYMTKIWEEKKRALKALDYFDFLDDDQVKNRRRASTLLLLLYFTLQSS